MTTPTPTLTMREATLTMREDVRELLNALPGAQGRAVRHAIVREVLALFDSTTAQPEPRKDAPAYVPTPNLPLPISDTNGAEPDAVDEAIERTFVEPSQTELRIMLANQTPNGFEVNR